MKKTHLLFKALLEAMPEGHWFGIAQLKDESSNSFPTAVGSTRDVVRKYLQSEGLGVTHSHGKKWKPDEDKIRTHINSTLELPSKQYQVTNYNRDYVYIAKKVSHRLAQQLDEEWDAPQRKPITRAIEQAAEDMAKATDDIDLLQCDLFKRAGRRKKKDGNPWDVPQHCNVLHQQARPGGKVRYILEVFLPVPPRVGISPRPSNPQSSSSPNASPSTSQSTATPVLDILRRLNIAPDIESTVVRELTAENKCCRSAGDDESDDARMIETIDGRNRMSLYAAIPSCTTRKSAVETMRVNRILTHIAQHFGSNCKEVPSHVDEPSESYCHGAQWMAEYLLATFPLECQEALEKADLKIMADLDPKQTVALMKLGGIKPYRARLMRSFFFAVCGRPILASEKKCSALEKVLDVPRNFGKYKYKDDKGKDATAHYWTRPPNEVVEHELVNRAQGGESIVGITFPLVDVPCISVCYLADHGNTAHRGVLTLVSNEKYGMGDILPVCHLQAKDKYDIITNTVSKGINPGLERLQESAIVVVSISSTGQSRIDHPILVPCRAVVGATAAPFAGMMLDEYTDNGTKDYSNVIVERKTAAVEGSAQFCVEERRGGDDATASTCSIVAMSWQCCDEASGDVLTKRKSFVGGSIKYSSIEDVSVVSYPIVMIGSGDKDYTSMIFGRWGMSSCRCNHCDAVTSTLSNGAVVDENGLMLTLEKMKQRAPSTRGSTGPFGQKDLPDTPIPNHLNGVSTLHLQLGPVLDAVYRHESWLDRKLEKKSQEEMSAYVTHQKLTAEVAGINNRIARLQSPSSVNEVNVANAQVAQLYPYVANGRPDPAVWEAYSSALYYTHVYREEMTEAQSLLVTKKAELAAAKDRWVALKSGRRNLASDNARQVLDTIFSNNTVDRNAYHKNSIDGPHTRILCSQRNKICHELESAYKKLRQQYIDEGIFTDDQVASDGEIYDEMRFFADNLFYFHNIFSILRKVRVGPIPTEEVSELERLLDKLKDRWLVQRDHEDSVKNSTPKFHDIFFHVLWQVGFLGRLWPYLEDPVERRHKEDRALDTLYATERSYERRENFKAQREAMMNNALIREYAKEIVDKRKRKFNPETEASRQQSRQEKETEKRRAADETYAEYKSRHNLV